MTGLICNVIQVFPYVQSLKYCLSRITVGSVSTLLPASHGESLDVPKTKIALLNHGVILAELLLVHFVMIVCLHAFQIRSAWSVATPRLSRLERTSYLILESVKKSSFQKVQVSDIGPSQTNSVFSCLNEMPLPKWYVLRGCRLLLMAEIVRVFLTIMKSAPGPNPNICSLTSYINVSWMPRDSNIRTISVFVACHTSRGNRTVITKRRQIDQPFIIFLDRSVK